MVYVHTILRDVAGLFKVGRLVAYKHSTVRPLDLLRLHHERIETWILKQAAVQFDAHPAPGALRVVAG